MSGISFTYGTIDGIPIPEDGISYGKISAQGINAYIEVDGILLGGNYSFETLTVTFKGVNSAPFSKPEQTGIGSEFSYDGRTWKITDVTPGAFCVIGGRKKYFSYTVTGIDFSSGRVNIG